MHLCGTLRAPQLGRKVHEKNRNQILYIIRILMAQAALLADILPRQLSFKHTLQLWIGWRWSGIGSNDHEKLHQLFILIAQQRVGYQLGRVEPRAIKRRHKPFPLLTKPRQLAREKYDYMAIPRSLTK